MPHDSATMIALGVAIISFFVLIVTLGRNKGRI